MVVRPDDRALGSRDLDPVQAATRARRAPPSRRVHAGEDGSAQVFALFGDTQSKVVAVPKSTAITGPPSIVEGRHGVHDAIGTDLAGVLVAHRHAGLDPGADHHRGGDLEELRADPLPDRQQRRNDARDHHVGDLFDAPVGLHCRRGECRVRTPLRRRCARGGCRSANGARARRCRHLLRRRSRTGRRKRWCFRCR